MSQCKEKTTCVFFRSLFDAAERIHETNPETAYEIYRSYFRYAFCETEDIETDDMVAELLVRQNVESFNAADERYSNAVKNGEKGKDYGVLGKEYGKLGGRPRKGETREEYWERKRKEQETGEKEPYTPPVDEKREKAKNLAKSYKRSDEEYGRGESTLTTGWIKKNILSGQKCVYCGEEDWHKLGCDRIDNTKPHTPDNVVCSCSKCNIERGSMSYEEFKEKKALPPKTPLISGDKETPLTVATAITTSEATTYSSSISKDITSSLSNNISKEEKKETTIEDDSKYYEDFLSNPTKDYSDLLNDVTNFVNKNITELNILQHNLNEYHQVDEYPTRTILNNLQYFYKEKLDAASKSNL